MATAMAAMGWLLALWTLCSAAAHAAAADPRDFLCQECLAVSTQAHAFFANPSNQQAALDYVNKYACHSMPAPEMRSKCLDMAEEYVPLVFATLEEYVSPDAICVQSGLCSAASGGGGKPAAPRLVRRWGLRPLAAAYDHYVTEGGLRSLLKQWPDRHLASLDGKRNNCALCQYVVLEMKLKLQNPKTQDKLLEFLLENCHKLHSHEDECKLIVLQYGPLILANVDSLLDAQLCAKIGMCPSSSSSSSSM